MEGPTPGWYPDPGDPTQHRWWDGEAWTAEVSPVTGAAPTSTPSDGPEANSTSESRAPWLLTLGVVAVLAGAGAAWGWMATDDSDPSPSASPESTSSESGEAPEAPEPADLRDLDWTSVPWTTECNASHELDEVHLSVDSRSDFGPLSHDPDPDAEIPRMVYTVGERPDAFGDVTGNGADDAIFITRCFFGNDWEHYVEVWTVDDDGQPLHLPPVLSYTKFDGHIDAVEVVDDTLHVITLQGAPGDDHPHLNGYPVEVTTAWTFRSQRWTFEEIERITPGEYGSDGYLDGLHDACQDGNIDACRDLYLESPIDSGYEFYGQYCGERMEAFCWETDHEEDYGHDISDEELAECEHLRGDQSAYDQCMSDLWWGGFD
jgi:hypothetical protein